MNLPSQRITLLVLISITGFLAIGLQHLFAASTQAQGGPSVQTTPSEPDKPPFQLPFAEPPGPDTWLLAQPYGNTTGAYFQRHTLYGASGGIHFGLDLAAPCGTEIVAIADGVVFAVDGSFGAPPHNLMIDHPQLEYASMYGHLLVAPDLHPGQIVKQGEVIALVGDQRGDCNQSPHLHLEIRDLKHFRKFNPVNLIDADWNKLALYSSWGRGFMRNLDDPRQWQNLYDQPQAQVGGPIINDFERTWPFDWSQTTTEARDDLITPTPNIRQPVSPAPSPVATPPPLAQIPAPLDPAIAALPFGLRQVTAGACCTNLFWSSDSTEVHFVDRPWPAAPVGVWGVDVTRPGAPPGLVLNRLGIYNHDRTLLAYPDRGSGLAVVEDLTSGEQWQLDTRESGVSFTPDGRLLWTEYDSDVEWRARQVEVWLADIDGNNAHMLAALERGGPATWLTDSELLVAQRLPPNNDILLSSLSIADGTLTELVQLPRTRGAAFSPDKRYMVYLVRFNVDSDKNGIWLLDFENPDLESEPLPFFGAYRWRDNRHLVYVPFDPEAEGHVFYEYDVVSGQTRPLFPKDGNPLKLTIANNNWQISPDGSKIALLAARETELDGIWVIDLGQD